MPANQGIQTSPAWWTLAILTPARNAWTESARSFASVAKLANVSNAAAMTRRRRIANADAGTRTAGAFTAATSSTRS